MKPKDRKYLQGYIREIADRLGLKDWRCGLSTAELSAADEDGFHVTAEAVVPAGYKHGHIRVCPCFAEHTPAEQRNVIVHELLHFHFSPARECVRNDLCVSRLLTQTQYDLFFAAFNRDLEYGIDSVTNAIDQFFPLPKWPKTQR